MSDETHPCDYAYPVAPGDVPYWQPGMTLRDYFAGQYIAGAYGGEPGSHLRTERAAVDAYALADAMMIARESNPNDL